MATQFILRVLIGQNQMKIFALFNSLLSVLALDCYSGDSLAIGAPTLVSQNSSSSVVPFQCCTVQTVCAKGTKNYGNGFCQTSGTPHTIYNPILQTDINSFNISFPDAEINCCKTDSCNLPRQTAIPVTVQGDTFNTSSLKCYSYSLYTSSKVEGVDTGSIAADEPLACASYYSPCSENDEGCVELLRLVYGYIPESLCDEQSSKLYQKASCCSQSFCNNPTGFDKMGNSIRYFGNDTDAGKANQSSFGDQTSSRSQVTTTFKSTTTSVRAEATQEVQDLTSNSWKVVSSFSTVVALLFMQI